MNNDSMIFWIKEVLEPYFKKMRGSPNNPREKCVILMDELSSHPKKNIIYFDSNFKSSFLVFTSTKFTFNQNF